MSKVTALVDADKQYLDLLIDAEVQSTISVETTEITEAVWKNLLRKFDQGDIQAKRACRALIHDGIRSRVGVRLHADRARVKVQKTGKVTSISARAGLLVAVKKKGERCRVYQQRFWWDYPWPDFDNLINTWRSRQAFADRQIEVYLEARQLRERFPDSRTPAEACEQAGIDPREFDLKAEAA